MIKVELPIQEVLHDFFNYNPSTGELFFNKKVDRKYFNSDKAYKQWHTMCAGKIAGSKDRQLVRLPCGYRERYCINRIIYKWMTGKENLEVTYNDNDITNLKWSNLKGYEDTSLMRHEHHGIFKNNKSGQKGIMWHKKLRQWNVSIGYKKNIYYIGIYIDYREAEKEIKKYKAAISNGTFLDVYNSRIKKYNTKELKVA